MSTKLKYPYAFGIPVVNRFVEKYARGYYFLARLLDLSPGALRHYLVLTLCTGNSLKWEAIKHVIVQNEGSEIADIMKYDKETRKQLYKRLVALGIDDALDGESEKKGLDGTRIK